MALQFRRVTEAQRLLITPAVGEPLYITDTQKLYIGDGVTAGGTNIISNVAVQDYLNVDLDDESLVDGAFIYYSADDDRWRIGLPTVNVTELSDITAPAELESSFMLVYNAESSKWIVREPLSRGIGDVAEFSVPADLSVDSVLEYNEEAEQFEALPLPPVPAIGDLLGVQTQGQARGQLLFYRGPEQGFMSEYIDDGSFPKYYGDLYNLEDLDIIKYNGETQRWERHAPLLSDVNLVSLSGLDEPEPDDIVFTVTVSENNRFAINGATAPALELYSDRNYVFDLSDPSLTGKTFQVSEVLDGTHSIDPPGEIYIQNRFTLTGTPGVDGEFRINTRTGGLGDYLNNLYYFCVEEPEFGNTLQFIGKAPVQPFVLQWNADLQSFDPKRFGYTLGEFDDVEITVDPEIGLADYQMLAWDAGNGKWSTPPDRVAGVGIGGGLPRTFDRITHALWRGGVQGLGTFDLDLTDGQMLKSLTINLDELEIEGEEELFDAYFFDTEEDRELWQEAVEEAEAALGPGGFLSREAIDELADQFGAKKARLQSNKKEYTRRGKQTAARGNIEVGGQQIGGMGAMGGMDLSAFGNFGPLDLSGLGGGGGGGGGGTPDEGSQEPGLDALTSPIPDLEEEAEEFKKAYKEFGSNTKKVFGAIMARKRTLDKLISEALGGPPGNQGLELSFEVIDPVNDPVPPTMFGWRASTDVYGYYYFTYTERASVLTYNSRDHYLIVQSHIRRCGCVLERNSSFRVVFYYDADDSRYMCGEWLRIIEFQRPLTPYTGDLIETPSTTIRANLEEWSADTLYTKGNRVIYNDQVWELMVDKSEASEPKSGTELAPTYVTEGKVEAFVEIPKFSVKSQLFEGVYQLRCTIGKDTEGGKTHPVFNFGSPGDDCDYLYVACNLMNANDISNIRPTSSNPDTYRNIRVGTKTDHRQFINSQNLDLGVFMYDMNVHSALQHLMVQEFQTFNIENRLGECRLAPTQAQYNREMEFTLDSGNASAVTQATDPRGNPAGIVTYRGIHRPYGNQGYFIDGININSADGSAYINKDSNTHSDGLITPPGYIFIDKIPKPVLNAQGTGSGFISNFHIWKSTEYTDFVYLLPRSIGGGRTNFLGDTLKYREVPSTSSLVVSSTGSPFQNPINSLTGENGPFNMNVQPLNGSNHIFGARVCVKRRGTSLTVEREKIGEKQLGTILDANGAVVSTSAEQSAAQPGQTWVFDRTVDVFKTVPGNDRISGEAGTATTSLGRQLASKSAVCIAVCDESDNNSQLFRNIEFSEKFKQFRELYPNRQHWLLVPTTTNPELTKPFPDSQLENHIFNDFPNVDPCRPISRNQRTSSPLTYRVKRGIDYMLPSGMVQAGGAVGIPDRRAFDSQSEFIANIAKDYDYARWTGVQRRRWWDGSQWILEEEQKTTTWYNIQAEGTFLQVGGLVGCVFTCSQQSSLPRYFSEPWDAPAVGTIPWRSSVSARQRSGCGGGSLGIGGIGYNSPGCACFNLSVGNQPGYSLGCSTIGTEWTIEGIWEFTNDGNTFTVQAQSPAWDPAPGIGSWHPKLQEYGVWNYDLKDAYVPNYQYGSNLDAYSNEATIGANKTHIIKYKIRLARQVPLIAFEFTGADQITVKLKHPSLNNGSAITVGTHNDPSTVKVVQVTQDKPVSSILTSDARGAVIDSNDWYDLIVEISNLTAETNYWVNPQGFYLRITGGNLIGNEWDESILFDAHDYASIQSDLYNPDLIDNMEVPVNYMRDAHFGQENHGPYLVTRDNGGPANATDWFKLCNLDEVSPGTIVGLFVDTSGSMSLNTVGASYTLFYQRCAENGLQISEVQNSNEDWILPFIDEI